MHTHLIPCGIQEESSLEKFREKWRLTFGNVHESVPLWRCPAGYPPKDVASLWPFCTKRRSILIIIFVFGRLVGRFNSSIFQCRWIEQIRRKKRKKKIVAVYTTKPFGTAGESLMCSPRRFLFSIETGPSRIHWHTQIESNWIFFSWKYGVVNI